jgi:flagellar hook-associated protein 1 FlgK
MSLGSIFNIGVSGLMTAQQRLGVASDNISNVNTEGYIRKIAHQEAQTSSGRGSGVSISLIRLMADQFLQAASLEATSRSGFDGIRYELLDQIQGQFGDIGEGNTLFSTSSKILTKFLEAAENPTSNPMRQEIIGEIQTFLDEAKRISASVQSGRASVEQRLGSAIDDVNQLLKDIAKLNVSITSGIINNTDTTGAQNEQSALIDQLSQLMDISVSTSDTGATTVRTGKGMLLVSINGASRIDYQPTSSVTTSTSFETMVITTPDGVTRDVADSLASGQIKGLLHLRDTDLVAVQEQLNQFIGTYSEALNQAHNASSSVPAPASLSGRALNLTQAEALAGFTGQSEIITLDTAGNIQNRLLIDFDARTLSLNGGPASAFADATFSAQATAALGGAATVSFDTTSRTLSLTASGAGGNQGVAVVDPATNSSAKLGKGFSHYFGLNDLIRPSDYQPTASATGLGLASNHGFTTGDSITFRIRNAEGGGLGDVQFAIPAGTSMTDLINSLNSPTTGLGGFGNFTFDSTGKLSFNGFGSPAHSFSVVADDTKRLVNGASLSQFFSLGGANLSGLDGLTIRSDIKANGAKLALARVSTTATGGQRALLNGNSDGANLLAATKDARFQFEKTSLHPGGLSKLSDYGAELAGAVGSLASAADRSRLSADTMKSEAMARRSSVEGVNLDEELVNLTTFQQAYAASSRVIQAAKEMFDVLLNM